MAGAIVPHETDVNLTNLDFSSVRSRNKREKNRFSDVIFITETQSPHGSTSSPRAEFFIAAHPELSRKTRPPRLSLENCG
jgi:hypothetical protein